MNTCIVTVYNTHNCGSYLQARALADAVNALGNEVCFLHRTTKNTNNSLKGHIIIGIKKLLRGDFTIAINEIKTQKSFDKAMKYLKVVSTTDKEYQNLDCFIHGSDTIWNLKDGYFNRNIDTYFGVNVAKKKIAYAPSIANTEISEFNDEKIVNALKSFSAVSTRDKKTSDMIESVTGNTPAFVCDPTLLHDMDYYNEIINDLPKLKDAPIFVYHFKHIEQKTIDDLKAYAKKNNKKIVTMGRDYSWSDVILPTDPYLFLQYMRDSSYVVTNTFHGTIFSLLYNKDFICLGKEKDKVNNIINTVGANDILFSQTDDISSFLGNKVNYDNINTILENIKQESIEYLRNSINEK